MSNLQTIKTQIQTLINNANATTGNSDTDLTTAQASLISGYGQGGGSGSSSGGNIEYENIIVKAPECKAMNVRSVENDCVVGHDCIIDGSRGWVYRAFLQYDFSNIPSDAEVLCASLNAFVYYGRDNYKDSECYVGRVTVDWTESTTYNWKNQPAHESYSSTSLDTPMFSPSDIGQWVSVDITSLVKQWINGTSANYGLVVRGIPENTYGTSWNIYTRRYSEGEYATYINVECKVPKNKEEEKEEILLQEKTVTENGEVVPDEGYDGLSKVIVDVKSSDTLEGLSNGYDVMFYDENNEGLAFYSIKQGHSIEAPVYTCKKWQKEDGSIVFFPLTPTSDEIIYANNDAIDKLLYSYYGIDRDVYPYVAIAVQDSSSDRLVLHFGTAIETDGTLTGKILSGEKNSLGNFLNTITDVNTLIQKTKDLISPTELTERTSSNFAVNQYYVVATNYEGIDTTKLKGYYSLSE